MNNEVEFWSEVTSRFFCVITITILVKHCDQVIAANSKVRHGHNPTITASIIYFITSKQEYTNILMHFAFIDCKQSETLEMHVSGKENLCY